MFEAASAGRVVPVGPKRAESLSATPFGDKSCLRMLTPQNGLFCGVSKFCALMHGKGRCGEAG